MPQFDFARLRADRCAAERPRHQPRRALVPADVLRLARCLRPLRQPASQAVVDGLAQARLERAIGVIYRPETERHSHYFDAVLPRQFDEYLWFDETRAVTPLPTEQIEGLPETYPFGL